MVTNRKFKSPRVILTDEEAETAFSIAADILEILSKYPSHIVNQVIKCIKEGLK